MPIRVFVFLSLAVGSIAGAAEIGSFSRSLYPVLERAACRSCHNPDGVASPTRLHFPEADATADQIEAFGKSLVVLVDRNKPQESLLLRKPTNRIPHTGGERVKPGSPEEAALTAWIQKLAGVSGDEVAKAEQYRRDQAAGTVWSGPPPSCAA